MAVQVGTVQVSGLGPGSRAAMLRYCLLDSLCSLSDAKAERARPPSVLPRLSAAVSSKDEGNVERAFDGHRLNLEIDQSESRWR